MATKKSTKRKAAKAVSKKSIGAKKAPVKKAVARKPVKAAGKSVARKPVRATAKRPHGIPETLRDAVLKVLDERQAEDIVTVDLTGKSTIADYLVIATGRNARQVAAIAGYLREAFFQKGIKNIRVEGKSEGNWVLVDGGDVVVHLFRPEVRRYYNLESIWDGNGEDLERSVSAGE